MVMNTFNTWINFMHRAWMDVPWWTSGDLVKFHSPTDFSSEFSKTYVIIDETLNLRYRNRYRNPWYNEPHFQNIKIRTCVHDDRLVSRRDAYGRLWPSCLAAPPSGLVHESPIFITFFYYIIYSNTDYVKFAFIPLSLE